MSTLVPKSDESTHRDVAIRRERNWIHESVVSVTRGARQDKDISQERLVNTLGWSKSVVVNLENLRRDLGMADFILIAEKVELDPQDLFACVMFHLRQRRRERKALKGRLSGDPAGGDRGRRQQGGCVMSHEEVGIQNTSGRPRK